MLSLLLLFPVKCWPHVIIMILKLYHITDITLTVRVREERISVWPFNFNIKTIERVNGGITC